MQSFKLNYLTNYIVNQTLKHLQYTFIINPLITVWVRTTSKAELRVCLMEEMCSQGGIDWTALAQDMDTWRELLNAIMNLRIQ
jgi:hypothetical protein